MIQSNAILDLAGELYITSNFWQIKNRLDRLVNIYLTQNKLCYLIEYLPKQFITPKPRRWQAIDWKNINYNDIIGIKKELFLDILIGIINTEAPIRGYTQTSRQYLAKIHPDMARFVGGITAEDGKILELGLWEKADAPPRFPRHLGAPRRRKTAQPYFDKSRSPANR